MILSHDYLNMLGLKLVEMLVKWPLQVEVIVKFETCHSSCELQKITSHLHTVFFSGLFWL